MHCVSQQCDFVTHNEFRQLLTHALDKNNFVDRIVILWHIINLVNCWLTKCIGISWTEIINVRFCDTLLISLTAGLRNALDEMHFMDKIIPLWFSGT